MYFYRHPDVHHELVVVAWPGPEILAPDPGMASDRASLVPVDSAPMVLRPARMVTYPHVFQSVNIDVAL